MVEKKTTSFTTALLQTELLVRVAGVVFALGVRGAAALVAAGASMVMVHTYHSVRCL